MLVLAGDCALRFGQFVAGLEASKSSISTHYDYCGHQGWLSIVSRLGTENDISGSPPNHILVRLIDDVIKNLTRLEEDIGKTIDTERL